MEITLNKWQSVLFIGIILAIGIGIGLKISPKKQINVTSDRVLARSLLKEANIVYERMPNPDYTDYSARHKITDEEVKKISKIEGVQHVFVDRDSPYTIGVCRSPAFSWKELDAKILKIIKSLS